MDETQSPSRETSRPSYTRMPSRSSTSSGKTRVPSQSNSDSSLRIDSPTLFTHPTHPIHRFHHSSCSKPTGSPNTTPRSTPQMSRAGSTEFTGLPAMSSYLQEKLDKERKAESSKLSQSSSRSFTNVCESSSDSNMKSPSKHGDGHRNRPRSSGGGADFSKVKQMGLREMEKATESLIKQNFDLKLKIHHYQEKQEKLQHVIEDLEAEANAAQKTNDQLVAELEKRDKAVSEAVAMIVMLEAKVFELSDTSSSNQALDVIGGQDPSPYEAEERGSTPVPYNRRSIDAKHLNRMPSFLSERSEHTENLRNAYLSIRSSALSLAPPDDSPENEVDPKGFASPTLSVLSESSFLSVYGQRVQDKISAMDLDHDVTVHGVDGVVEQAQISKAHAPRGETPRLTSHSGTKPITEQRQGSVGSPLQRIERMDPAYMGRRETIHSQYADTEAYLRSYPPKAPNRELSKQGKRASLSKVMTGAPHDGRLHDPNLPPTPDTISSSTLRRFQTSSDTLSGGEPFLRDYGSNTSDYAHTQSPFRSQHQSARGPVIQTALRAMDDNASSIPGTKVLDFGQSIVRPMSAGETSIMRRKGNDWGSDSDESDAASADSSLDIWLHEGAKADGKKLSISPDLFGFPTNGQSWAPNAMTSKNLPLSSDRLDTDDLDVKNMDNLFSIQHAIFATGGAPTPPPPPNRRSSLHARTGSLTMSPRAVSGLGKSHVSPERFSTQQRRNSDFARRRGEDAQPIQTNAQQPGEQKQGYYPPSRQLPSRSGLTKIFRRSIGGTIHSSPANSAASRPMSIETTQSSGGMGIPSRVSQIVDDGISTSATPPPILRNPRHGRRHSVGLETSVPSTPSADFSGPSTPVTVVPATKHRPSSSVQPSEGNEAAASPAGNRKKWFGKMSNLKNKAG